MKQPVLFGSGGSSGIWIQTIAVTAPNGASITVSGGGETLTGTGTGSNYAFQVHNQNTLYTISVTMDGQTKTDTVTTGTAQGAISFVVINFGTINLTYANDFRGKTITCTKSGVTVTKTAPSSGNTMTIRVPTTGTWTISGVVSGQTYSVDAVVSSLSTAVSVNLQTIPNGKTVTPTDNIQKWLNCAGIFNKTSYTTLSQVLADSTTLLALMSDNNAVDYLVRSTTWANGVTANSTAMTDIGANNYAADTLLNNTTWRNSICNSANFEIVLNQKVPTLTGSSTAVIASGFFAANSEPWYAFDNNTNTQWVSGYKSTEGDPWCGYHFNKNIKVNKVHLMNHDGYYMDTGEIQGSNDGTNWTKIADITGEAVSLKTFDYNVANNNYYSYYRIYINTMFAGSGLGAFRIIQFYGREEV